VDHLYGSVAELRAEIEDEHADPHLAAASVLFGLPGGEVRWSERRWGKYLNMAAVTGLSLAGLADLAQVPLDKAREMRERYCRLVLA